MMHVIVGMMRIIVGMMRIIVGLPLRAGASSSSG